MKQKKFIFMLLIGILTLPLKGAETTKFVINERINQIFTRHNFQGAALVTKNDIPIHHKGYGMAIMEWNIPNTPITKYHVASLSKTFTGALIMMLVEEGQLSLDESVRTYLPDYPADYASKVTIRHLLTHRTGIPRQFKIPGWQTGKSLATFTKQEFLSMIAALPLEFEVDSARLYSSANYYILGALIEQITGESFAAVLHQKILQPLKMQSTDVYRRGQLVEGLATAYKSVESKYSYCPPVEGEFCTGGNINLELFKASGSMYSTTGDLSIWLQALDEDLVLNKTSKAFLFDPDIQACWEIQTVLFTDNKHRKLVIADGELEGNSSLLIKLPEEQISVVILSNTGMTYRQKAEIGLEIADLLLSK